MQPHIAITLPMSAFITFFVELLLFPGIVLSWNCNAPPLVVPITNTTLSTGFQRRGIPISVGTPAQKFSLKILTKLNNTVLKEGPITDDNCDKIENSESRCIMVKGGVYNRGVSSSWSGHMSKDEFKGSPENFKSIDIMGEETMRLPGLDLKNLPIGIENEAEVETSGLGLSVNSSFLNTLLAAGDIPSRVWGLDWGWTGGSDDTWADGSLVLGGYDKSRVKDDKFFAQDFTMDLGENDGCSMLVFITGITMKNSTNELQLLDSRGESIRACVTPDYDLMSLPFPVFTKFNDAMGGVYTKRSVGAFYLWGYESDAEASYEGSMIIKLSNGFSTTIPNHQLIQPYRDYDFSGKPLVSNTQKSVLRVNGLEEVNAGDLPLLGLPFLSSSYLIVDPDKKQFQLGQSVRSQKEDLVSLTLTQCAESSGAPTATQAPQSSSIPDASSPSKIGIVAGVAGALVALVVSVLIFIAWTRSKKQKVERVDPPAESKGGVYESEAHELDSCIRQVSAIYEADSTSVQSPAGPTSTQY